MQESSIELNFLSLFSFLSFFIFLIIIKFSNKIANGLLIDDNFTKPQSFHDAPIPRSGGLASFVCFIIFFILHHYIFNHSYLDYIFIGFCLFSIGFIDDIKYNLSPKTRLALMIFALSIGVSLFQLSLSQIDFIFLQNLLENKLFLNIFLTLCFLFVVNGANLVDGFNGLLSIHLIIINLILLYINLESKNLDYSVLIVSQIIILLVFTLFNFPKAKVFLGDSGAYLHGSITALNVINTDGLNNQISSFFFCILLFYLFFEVFFSFFRKLLLNRSPLKPDNIHLHMITYKFLKTKFQNKDCNYLNSIVINISYLTLIIPALVLKENGLFCKFWFLFTLIIYVIFYFRLYRFTKNQINI